MGYGQNKKIQRRAKELAEVEEDIDKLSEKFGLEPYPVQNWLVDYEEMDQLSAYSGFQERYPHWRWGMKYEQMSKKSKYMNSAPYELVINSDPSHAYLQESNKEVIQKLVMAHVNGHSDFFAKNSWFKMLTDAESAVEKLSEHAERIESYMKDPEIDREEVEKWIDSVLTVEFNIDQNHPEHYQKAVEEVKNEEKDLKEVLSNKGFDPEIVDHVFRNMEEKYEKEEKEPRREKDILRYLEKYGKAYDKEKKEAVEMENWQKEIISMIREESYYFAPQMMTKTMNEGWAAYWHTKVMSGESFAKDDEFIEYAKTQSKVLSGGGMNPYKVGKELWEYIENKENRKEVYRQLLKVEGINRENIETEVDFEKVLEQLENRTITELNSDRIDKLKDREELVDTENLGKILGIRESIDKNPKNILASLEEYLEESELEEVENYVSDKEELDEKDFENIKKKIIDVDTNPWKILSYEGLAERHYSLIEPGKREFIKEISEEELEILDNGENIYSTVKEAIGNVDKTSGWERMYEVRENYNDVLFVNEFMTQEFVDRNNYFSYENISDGQNAVPIATSTKAEDIKKKFLLKTVNFGKPRVKVESGNYRNKGGLLLEHDYNGIEIDREQAAHTLKFLHNLWGRDVHLKTITKEKDGEYQKKVQNFFQAMSMAAQKGGKLEDVELPRPKEKGVLMSFDGDELKKEELGWEKVEHLSSEEVDYNTLPEEWLI